MPCPALSVRTGAVEIAFYVQPRASRNKVIGMHGEAIKVQLTAPPVDGEANLALIKFVAKKLDISRREVELIAGPSSRHKRVRVTGLKMRQVEERLLGTCR